MTEQLTEGVIVKGIGGFYYVADQTDQIFTCKARGLFRKQSLVPAVGDCVGIEVRRDGESVIREILPRQNAFIRPPIANVEQFVVVTALASPDPLPALIDRFLVMAEYQNTDIVVCFNKTDLAGSEVIRRFEDIYAPLYRTVFVSGRTGQGLDNLKQCLKGRRSALAGPSGVGKSTLLNRLLFQPTADVGAVADKTGRGRHTTRHVELFRTEFGMVFDTPGFTSFDVLEMNPAELALLFPEMEKRAGTCRYDNCRHLTEPDCRIRSAVDAGQIALSRYDAYCQMMAELQEKRKHG